MSSQRITRSSTRAGLRALKTETTMTLKRGGSVPVSTRPPSKEVREEKLKKLLQAVGENPPLDAVNTAKRIIELEHELLHGKKSKKKELELELAGAVASLQVIAKELREDMEIDQEEQQNIEDDAEDMTQDSSPESDNNRNMIRELDAIENEDTDMKNEEEKEGEDMEVDTPSSEHMEQEIDESKTEKIQGDFVRFKASNQSSLKEAVNDKKVQEENVETKDSVHEITQTPEKNTAVKAKNPYKKKKDNTNNAWGKKNTLDVVLGESKKKNNKDGNIFRVRATYKGKQTDSLELSLQMELLRILKDFTSRAKKVDPECDILVWNSCKEEDHVVENASKLAPFTAAKYVGMPMSRKGLGTVKNKMGFRISSKLTLFQFVDAWSKLKGFKEGVYLAEAEMQSSPTSFAVGICQGSSPKKVTKLLNERLPQVLNTDVKVEASWQVISKDDLGNGIVEDIWKQANEKSKEAGDSKRLLNLYNPSGLIIYVSDIKAKRSVKNQLQLLFGHGSTTSDWALWPDGSIMRFIPFVAPTAKERSIEKVKQMIRHHVHCKADEKVRDLDAVDLFTPREYLEGKTLHEAILSIQSKKMKGQPVFRHIARKWTRNHMEHKYVLTSYSILAEEADAAAEGLMAILHDKYGNDVIRHFPGTSLNISQNYNEYRQQFETEDPYLEDLLEKVEIEIDYELTPDFPFSEKKAKEYGLLNDGQSTLNPNEIDQQSKESNTPKKKNNETKKPKAQYGYGGKNTQDGYGNHTQSPYSQRNGQDSSEESHVTFSDSVSMLTDQSEALDEYTVKTGTTKVTNSSEKEWMEMRSIQRKLERTNLNYSDIDKWSNDNPDSLKVIQQCHSTKYKQVCSIITTLAISKKTPPRTEPNKEVNNEKTVEDERTPESSSHPT